MFYSYSEKAFVFPLWKAKKYDKEETDYIFLDNMVQVLNVGVLYMGDTQSFITKDKNLAVTSLQKL